MVITMFDGSRTDRRRRKSESRTARRSVAATAIMVCVVSLPPGLKAGEPEGTVGSGPSWEAKIYGVRPPARSEPSNPSPRVSAAVVPEPQGVETKPEPEPDHESKEVPATAEIPVPEATEAEVDKAVEQPSGGPKLLAARRAWEGDSPIFPAGKSGQSPSDSTSDTALDKPVEYDALERKVHDLFPDSMVKLIPVADKLIVRGHARDADEAAEILSAVCGEPGGRNTETEPSPGAGDFPVPDVINLLELTGPTQVGLNVRLAELDAGPADPMGAEFPGADGDFIWQPAPGSIRPGSSGRPRPSALQGSVVSHPFPARPTRAGRVRKARGGIPWQKHEVVAAGVGLEDGQWGPVTAVPPGKLARPDFSIPVVTPFLTNLPVLGTLFRPRHTPGEMVFSRDARLESNSAERVGQTSFKPGQTEGQVDELSELVLP